jgi:hypothetical protein
MIAGASQLRFGPYLAPVVVPGTIVECEVRGLVTVAGTSTGPLRWPIGRKDERDELIVFKGLARAVRQETPAAIAAAFGVSRQIAEQWRSACRAPRHRKKQTRKSLPIAWKPSDDEIICTMPLMEAARLTGRTVTAVRKRRRLLGLPDGRLAAHKPHDDTLEFKLDMARQHLREQTAQLAESLAALRGTMTRAKATAAFWQTTCQPPAALSLTHGHQPGQCTT